MNKKVSLGAAIAFSLIVAAMVFSITRVFSQNQFNKNTKDLEARQQMYEKLSELDSVVRENLYGTINEAKLMDSIATGYINGIDDTYGTYHSAEEYKKMTQSKEGEDVGIGAVLSASTDGYLVVNEVYPDSPAQVAEIVAGDTIVKVNDIDLKPENSEQLLASIQGAAGTKLTLVVRKGTEDVTVELTRRAVAVPSVYSRMIPNTAAGYILIKQFNDNTADQFSRELNKVIEAGADYLIFDVRDNKGATMNAAVRMLDKLAPEGIIYSATFKDGTTEVRETSDANEIAMPMAVLVNGGTASAAELFAQDLKDFGKASIIGSTTMGKGVLQSTIPLSDGSAIDITTALFNPTSGINFNETGIKPDYEVPLDSDWSKLDENTDAQLKKALEVVLAMQKAENAVNNNSSSSSAAASQPLAISSSSSTSSSQGSISSESSSEADEEASDEDESDSSNEDESGNSSESESSSSSQP